MQFTKNKKKALIAFYLVLLSSFYPLKLTAEELWVGETYECDAQSSMVGSITDVSWTTNGGYFNLSGSGYYRKVKATQYWSGTASVTCSWRYTFYYGGTQYTDSKTWYFTCRENPVSISPTSMTLNVGETGRVTYSHMYSNSYTSYANVYFSSSSSCVSVTSTGYITALSPGTAYVHVYSNLSDASNSPYCKVTVEEGEVISPTDISVSPSSLTMTVGESHSLSASVTPSNATYSLTWSSGDNNIASVSSSGEVTAKHAGSTIITVKTNNGKSASCAVTVNDINYSDGDTFKSKTSEGVEMEFMVISTKDKTCQVGSDEGNASIDKKYNGALTIPETVNGLTVTSIAFRAFYECKITSITMPNSITHISDQAFYYCRSLSTIYFSENLVYVGGFSDYYQKGTYGRSKAFNKTSWEDNQPDGLIYAGPVAYYYKGNMPENTHITIKEGTKGITEGCFEREVAKNLTSLTIPESVEHVGRGVFNETTWYNNQPKGLLYIGRVAYSYIGKDEMPAHTTITLKEGTTEVSGLAFADCPNIERVIIPKSTKRVEKYAFAACANLSSIEVENGNPYLDSRYSCNAVLDTSTDGLLFGCKNTVIPKDCKRIEEGAFYGCTGLESISIGGQVVFIGLAAFQKCSSLKSIHFGDAVKKLSYSLIGKSALEGCTNVESIHIGKSMTGLCGLMFSALVNLNSITVSEENKEYDSRNNCNAIINKETKQLIKGCGTTIIPNDVTEISYDSFYKNLRIEEISIPNSVEIIESDAFDYCSNLKSVFIGTGLKKLQDHPFELCSSLNSIVVAAGNSTYDSRSNCNAIIEKSTGKLLIGCNNTSIPNSVLGIGKYAFYGLKLKSVVIPDRVKTIEHGAFLGCNKLETVVIGSSVDSIGSEAFYACYSLDNIYAKMEKPCEIEENVFLLGSSDNNYKIFDNAILHVPQGTKSSYFATSSWNRFENIEEFDTSAEIETITIDEYSRKREIYSISGLKLPNQQKGVNIINGEIKFVK